MSDPLALHARHEQRIRREELRELVPGSSRYLDVPHFFAQAIASAYAAGVTRSAVTGWTSVLLDAGSFASVGAPGVSYGAPYLTLPPGSWSVRSELDGSASGPWRQRVRVRLAADLAPDAIDEDDEPLHFAIQDLTLRQGVLGGALELPPLTSDGALKLWLSIAAWPAACAVDLTAATRIVCQLLGPAPPGELP